VSKPFLSWASLYRHTSSRLCMVTITRDDSFRLLFHLRPISQIHSVTNCQADVLWMGFPVPLHTQSPLLHVKVWRGLGLLFKTFRLLLHALLYFQDGRRLVLLQKNAESLKHEKRSSSFLQPTANNVDGGNNRKDLFEKIKLSQKDWTIAFIVKGIVSRDFVVCFLVSFDRSYISIHQERVLLLLKVRFRIEFFDFRVWA
jgi:hypothetical protein